MVILERLPLSGDCIALRPPGHAAGAYDLVGVDAASRKVASRSLLSTVFRLPVETFHGWRRPVVAPGRGTVRAVHDEVADRPTVSALRDLLNGFALGPVRHGRDIGAMAGNHVLIEIDDAHVLLAHLRRGSVVVRPGDAVDAGAAVGEVGNSGNTVAPHLHVQVMASPDVFDTAVLPWRPASCERWSEAGWRPSSDALPLRTVIRSPA